MSAERIAALESRIAEYERRMGEARDLVRRGLGGYSHESAVKKLVALLSPPAPSSPAPPPAPREDEGALEKAIDLLDHRNPDCDPLAAGKLLKQVRADVERLKKERDDLSAMVATPPGVAKMHADVASERDAAVSARREADAEVKRLVGELQTAIAGEYAAERQAERLREALEWLDRRGGLGIDAHEHIRAVLAPNPAPGVALDPSPEFAALLERLKAPHPSTEVMRRGLELYQAIAKDRAAMAKAGIRCTFLVEGRCDCDGFCRGEQLPKDGK